MLELSHYFWETLLIFWQFQMHGMAAKLLRIFGNIELDEDLIYELSMEAICAVFADTRNYYQEEQEIDVFVFFDPELDAFYEVCRSYESQLGISPEENCHRKQLVNAIESALSFPDYSYDFYVYSDLQERGRCRIVLMFYNEFFSLPAVPGGLLEILDALRLHTQKMKQELAANCKLHILPAVQEGQKEAA